MAAQSFSWSPGLMVTRARRKRTGAVASNTSSTAALRSPDTPDPRPATRFPCPVRSAWHTGPGPEPAGLHSADVPVNARAGIVGRIPGLRSRAKRFCCSFQCWPVIAGDSRVRLSVVQSGLKRCMLPRHDLPTNRQWLAFNSCVPGDQRCSGKPGPGWQAGRAPTPRPPQPSATRVTTTTGTPHATPAAAWMPGSGNWPRQHPRSLLRSGARSRSC